MRSLGGPNCCVPTRFMGDRAAMDESEVEVKEFRRCVGDKGGF